MITIRIEDHDTRAEYLIDVDLDRGRVQAVSRNYLDGAQARILGTAHPGHESGEYTIPFETFSDQD